MLLFSPITRADDADVATAQGEPHGQNAPAIGTHAVEPGLCAGVRGIRQNQTARIVKGRWNLGKINAVLMHVRRFFRRIPLEGHAHKLNRGYLIVNT